MKYSESNGAIPNDVIHNIAEDISTDWKHLGRKLELSPGLLDGIDHDFRQVKEKTLQMLSRWKERKGDDATGQILADALVNIHRRDVAEDLQGNSGILSLAKNFQHSMIKCLNFSRNL